MAIRESMAITSAPETVEVPDLQLLLVWPERRSRSGWAAIFAASTCLNLLALSLALHLSNSTGSPLSVEHEVVVHKTPLYFPPSRLTQKAPNTRTPSKSVDLADLLATEQLQARRAAPRASSHHFEIPKTPVPPRPVAKNTPPQATAAPDIALNAPTATPPPGAATGLPANIPPPPAPADQPFQNVGSELTPSHPTMAVPKASVQGALQSLSRTPNGSQLIISDDNQSRPSPPIPGQPGQTAAQHAQVELQSDPQGADFRIYLAHILSIVRTNWRRVIPESARMGTLRGRTVVEFIIDRDGSIPKLVTADPSGSDALDRAAVAGLSMSNPLPPLPADFKGFQVRLAFTFSYNLPSP
jgi:TonB family protein